MSNLKFTVLQKLYFYCIDFLPFAEKDGDGKLKIMINTIIQIVQFHNES